MLARSAAGRDVSRGRLERRKRCAEGVDPFAGVGYDFGFPHELEGAGVLDLGVRVPDQPRSTASLRPAAFRMACSVEKRGFPPGDRAR